MSHPLPVASANGNLPAQARGSHSAVGESKGCRYAKTQRRESSHPAAYGDGRSTVTDI
jgi:hypothetical protein